MATAVRSTATAVRSTATAARSTATAARSTAPPCDRRPPPRVRIPALLVGYANFFGLRCWGSQRAPNAGTGATIGLVLFTLHAVVHPFRGEIRWDAGEFRIALEWLRAESQ